MSSPSFPIPSHEGPTSSSISSSSSLLSSFFGSVPASAPVIVPASSTLALLRSVYNEHARVVSLERAMHLALSRTQKLALEVEDRLEHQLLLDYRVRLTHDSTSSPSELIAQQPDSSCSTSASTFTSTSASASTSTSTFALHSPLLFSLFGSATAPTYVDATIAHPVPSSAQTSASNMLSPLTPGSFLPRGAVDAQDWLSSCLKERVTSAPKPFGWDYGRGICDLVLLCREEPGVVARALALCTGDVLAAHRKQVSSFCRFCVSDLFGICNNDENAARHSIEQRVLHFLTLTLRLMYQQVQLRLCTPKIESASQHVVRDVTNAYSSSHADETDQNNISETSPVAADIIESSNTQSVLSATVVRHHYRSFSVLDHSTLPLKLLNEYLVQYGSTYLAFILVEPLNAVIECDEAMSLDVDLMGPSPRSDTGAEDEDSSEDNETISAIDEVSERLFAICDQMLHTIVSSLDRVPYGIRWLSRVLFELTHRDESFSCLRNDNISEPQPSLDNPCSPYRVCSDYLFLNWLITAIIHPETCHLHLAIPFISQSQRRSLQAVSTVLIKLMSGSFFNFDSRRQTQLNDWLHRWHMPLTTFIRDLTRVPCPWDTSLIECRSHAEAMPVAALTNDFFCLHSLIQVTSSVACSAEHSSTSGNFLFPQFLKVFPRLKSILDVLRRVPEPVLLIENRYLVLNLGIQPVSFVAFSEGIKNFPNDFRSLAELLMHALLTCDAPLDQDITLSYYCKRNAVIAELSQQRDQALLLRELANLIDSKTQGKLDSFNVDVFLEELHILLQNHLLSLSSSKLLQNVLQNEEVLVSRLENVEKGLQCSYSSLRQLQVRRLLDMMRPRLKRLKKHLRARLEKEQSRLSAAYARTYPSVHISNAEHAVYHHCSNDPWPDSSALAKDHLLCMICQKALDKRKSLLNSFWDKYVIGEPVFKADSIHKNNNSSVVSSASVLPMARPVAESGTLRMDTRNDPKSSGGGTSQSNSAQVFGSALGQGHTLISVNIGPILDLNDQTIYAEVSTAIALFVWPEICLHCVRVDRLFVSRSHAFVSFCEDRFDIAYILLALSREDISHFGIASVLHIVKLASQNHDTENVFDFVVSALPSNQRKNSEAMKRFVEHVLNCNAPAVSQLTFEIARSLFSQLTLHNNCRNVLQTANQLRSVLTAALGFRALISFGPSETGSVDDYMCLLTFCVLKFNVNGFLSQLANVQTLVPHLCEHSKAFADLLIACKAAIELSNQFATDITSRHQPTSVTI